MAVLSESIEKYTSYDYELTEFTLATGVGRICSMRGWIPAQGGHTQDQGLIVAYLKSGVAYYRNYCLQSDGTSYIWEEERLVDTLPTGLTDIALFRTNDFRIGVLGRDGANNVHVTVTVRNYAGMSLYPEMSKVRGESAMLDFIPITFVDADSGDEVSRVTADKAYADFCPYDYEVIAHDGSMVGSTKGYIQFNYPVTIPPETIPLFSIPNYEVTDAVHLGNGKVEITFTPSAGIFSDLTVSYAWDSIKPPVRANVTPDCNPPIFSFSADMKGLMLEVVETSRVQGETVSLEMKEIVFVSGSPDSESSRVEGQSAILTFTHIDDDPI